MCHRGAFREDINKKCLLCEKEDIGIDELKNKIKQAKAENYLGIAALLAERNYSVYIAQLGLATAGGSTYSPKDVHKFGNCLDSIVAQKLKRLRLVLH